MGPEISSFVFGRREKVIRIWHNIDVWMDYPFKDPTSLHSIQSGCRDRKITPTANQQSLMKVRFVWKDKQGKKSLACLPPFVCVSTLLAVRGVFFIPKSCLS